MQNSFIIIGIAFLGGIASFLSPCVLPLVPGYISLISGVSIDKLKEGSSAGARRAVMLNSVAFSIGLSVIFLALGATAGLLGGALLKNFWVSLIGGLVIIGFGLQLIGVLKIGALYKDTRMFSNDKPRGMLGSFTLGIAFAAGWTPCIGPIITGICTLAASSGGWRRGLMLSAFYSAGLAIPFLITGLGINKFLGFYSGFRKHLHKVELVSGAVLIAVGVLVATGYLTVLTSSKLATLLPDIEGRLSRLIKQPPPPAPPPVTAGKKFDLASDVQFQTLAGAPFHLSELRGHVVLLNFWATWCGPCRAEIPELNSLQHDLEAKGLKVLGATLEDSAAGVNSYQRDVKFEYAVLIGGREAKAQFATPGLPTTYLIDRQGRIRETIVGSHDRAGWEAAVKPLLDETP